MQTRFSAVSAAGIAALLLTGCASLEQRAYTAAAADTATTAAGLALGLVELNPLGPAAGLLKIPYLIYAHSLPEDERAELHAQAGSIWGGISVSNGCMLAALITGGAFAPACIVAGIGYGIYRWNADTPERAFYAACANYRRYSGESFTCRFVASVE